MRAFFIAVAAAALGVAAMTAACNNPGTCPAASDVVPGGSCSGDNLQCPYTLPGSASGAGATSCVCTGGAWSCPSAGDGGDDGGSDASADGTTDDGGSDGATSDGPTTDGPVSDATTPDGAPADAGTSDASEGGSVQDAPGG